MVSYNWDKQKILIDFGMKEKQMLHDELLVEMDMWNRDLVVLNYMGNLFFKAKKETILLGCIWETRVERDDLFDGDE